MYELSGLCPKTIQYHSKKGKVRSGHTYVTRNMRTQDKENAPRPALLPSVPQKIKLQILHLRYIPERTEKAPYAILFT